MTPSLSMVAGHVARRGSADGPAGWWRIRAVVDGGVVVGCVAATGEAAAASNRVPRPYSRGVEPQRPDGPYVPAVDHSDGSPPRAAACHRDLTTTSVRASLPTILTGPAHDPPLPRVCSAGSVHRWGAALAGAAICLAAALPAVAHTELIGSSPADGATLTTPPAEVLLEFSEAVQAEFGQVAVLDDADVHHEQGNPQIVGATVTQGVDELSAGTYRISYRVGSADGHPITGTLTFTVTAAAETTPPDAPSTTPTPVATSVDPHEGMNHADHPGDGHAGGGVRCRKRRRAAVCGRGCRGGRRARRGPVRRAGSTPASGRADGGGGGARTVMATATRASSAGPSTRRWGSAAVAALLVVLVVGLLLGGGGSATPVAGLPDPGALTRWGLPVAKAILDGAVAVTIGLILLAALLPAPGGELGRDALRALRAASNAAAVWAVAAAVVYLLTLSDLIGVPCGTRSPARPSPVTPRALPRAGPTPRCSFLLSLWSLRPA